MSTQDLAVRILVAVAVSAVILVAVAVAYSYLSIGLFLSWMLFFIVAGVIVLYNSVHLLNPGQMIVMYWFGTQWTGTVVNDDYYAEHEKDIMKVSGGENVRTGLLSSVAFGWWPFYWAYRLPATTFEIPISASAMYTKTGQPGEEDLPRIRLYGDGTLQLRLHPVLRKLPSVLPIIRKGGARDLTEIVPLENAPLGPDGKVVNGPRIADLINGVVKKPVLQAMRTAASEFTWGARSGGKDTDIINCRDEYEWAIQRVLLQPGSVFIDAGFLRAPSEAVRKDPERWREYEAEKGDSLMVFDVVVELIKPEPTPENASELEKAIDLAYIGFQEGARQRSVERLRRVGQAEGLAAMAEKLHIDEDQLQLVLLEALREGKFNVTTIGGSGAEGLIGYVENLIRSKAMTPGATPPTT